MRNTNKDRTTFASPTRCSELVVPTLNRLPGRLIFLWSWLTFCDWATFCLASVWWRMTRNADLVEPGVAEPLQAWIPSVHVWSNFVSLAWPQFLNQAPPRAQQLRLPNFVIEPHSAHLLRLLLPAVCAREREYQHVWPPMLHHIVVMDMWPPYHDHVLQSVRELVSMTW